MHKSGFVNIVGKPNVGKSTLMNVLVGERMAIISNKPQTTRHRIIGIVSGDDFQVVFSDTPGFIEAPAYKMQRAMNAFVSEAFEDADLVLIMVDATEVEPANHPFAERLKKLKVPVFLVLNKMDLASKEKLEMVKNAWLAQFAFAEVVEISAKEKRNTDFLFQQILKYLPEGPEYYPKDQLTDRAERFFVSEIVREKILELYHQEIPYSCEVLVESFKETETNDGKPLVRIAATIFVNRKTQKSILIGKNGEAIKQLGSAARKDLEVFLEKKVFLELYVKVKEGWRDNDQLLKGFGYGE
jgi:GTP-binding protein Era